MVRKIPSASSVSFFLLSSIFLMLVQYGVISPRGLVIITYDQYTVLFWLSIAIFISSLAILFTQFPYYAKWSIGYTGDCVRTVRIPGKKKDLFIRGAPDATVREVLLDNWPFDSRNPNSGWQVFDSLENEVSGQLLESITETLEVVFPPDESE